MKVVIDGTIGSGKSTVLKGLASSGFPVFLEPIESWTPMMDMYYKEPKKYAFMVNSVCMNDLFHRDSEKVIECSFYERSIHSSFHIFQEMSFRMGHVNLSEFEFSRRVYRRLAEKQPASDMVFLWIDVSPEIARKRIVERGTSEMSCEDISYFTDITRRYKEYYQEGNNKVIRIDGDQTPEKVLKDVLEAVKTFL